MSEPLAKSAAKMCAKMRAKIFPYCLASKTKKVYFKDQILDARFFVLPPKYWITNLGSRRRGTTLYPKSRPRNFGYTSRGFWTHPSSSPKKYWITNFGVPDRGHKHVSKISPPKFGIHQPGILHTRFLSKFPQFRREAWHIVFGQDQTGHHD
jgi:hypothetical protein